MNCLRPCWISFPYRSKGEQVFQLIITTEIEGSIESPRA